MRKKFYDLIFFFILFPIKNFMYALFNYPLAGLLTTSPTQFFPLTQSILVFNFRKIEKKLGTFNSYPVGEMQALLIYLIEGSLYKNVVFRQYRWFISFN